MSSMTRAQPPVHKVRHSLRDGSEVILRPLEPDDVDVVREVFDGLSPVSRQRRFMVPKHTLTAADVRKLTAVDHCDHEALAVLSAADGRPVGIARFVRYQNDPGTADVAIVVVDAWHARGVGSLLASALLARARELGVRRLSIMIAHDNKAAARLLRRVLGDVAKVVAVDRGTVEFVVSLTPVPSRGRRTVLKGA